MPDKRVGHQRKKKARAPPATMIIPPNCIEYIPDVTFSNCTELLCMLECAVTIPEKMLLTNEKLRTDYDARVDRIVKNIVKVIQNRSMKNKICNPQKCQELDKQQTEDLHSILFYCVLKNNGIECKEADEYYEVLDGFFPHLDWDMYMAIIIACRWSELFAECIRQLPDAAAMVIIKLFITKIGNKNYDNEFIIYHGILEAIMAKLLPNNNSSKPAGHMVFQFPFAITGNTAVGTEISSAGSEPSGNTEEDTSFLEVLNHALEVMNHKNGDRQLANVLLNGLTTAFDAFLKSESHDPTILTDLEQYWLFMEQYFLSEDALNFLETEMESFEFFEFVQAISLEKQRFGLCGYLLILIHEKCGKVEEAATLDCESKTFCTLDKLVRTLLSHHPLKQNKPVKEEYIKLLTSLIKNDLDGKITAFDFLVADAAYLKRADVLSCMEKYIHVCTNNEGRKLMAATFAFVGSEKTQLFKLFLDWYRGVDSGFKQELLQSCLLEFGLSAFTKTSTFDADLTNFLKTVVDVDKAIFLLPQFCMQSPHEVLQKIVVKILEDGTTSLVLVKALKTVSCVCSYQRTPACLPLLIEVLKSYLVAKSLSSTEEKNMNLLIEELLTVFSCDNTFSRHHFILHCLLPNFTSTAKFETIEFFMDVLGLILNDSLATGFVSWFTENRPLPLVFFVSSMLNYCFRQKNTPFKRDIIKILHTLVELHKQFNVFDKLQTEECQNQLKKHLCGLNPIVKFYVLDFIQEPDVDLSSLPLDHLLFWCILRENDLSQIDDCIVQRLQTTDRLSVVKAVSQDLVYLTLEEIPLLYQLLKKFGWQSSTNSESLEAEEINYWENHCEIVPLTELFVDAFLTLQTDAPTLCLKDAINTFCSLMHCNCKDACVSLPAFKKVFLEICKLATKLSICMDVFCTLLISLVGEMGNGVTDQQEKDAFKALKEELCGTVNALGECVMKPTLLFHFENSE